jgi:hypothetical protein
MSNRKGFDQPEKGEACGGPGEGEQSVRPSVVAELPQQLAELDPGELMPQRPNRKREKCETQRDGRGAGDASVDVPSGDGDG